MANISSEDYILGITSQFKFSEVKIALYKSTTFGFLMSSISSFIGFNTKDGGSVEVGKASTKAFTVSSIIILIADCFIARLFLNFYKMIEFHDLSKSFSSQKVFVKNQTVK